MWEDLNRRQLGEYWLKMMMMGIYLSIERSFMIFIRNSDRFMFGIHHLFLKKVLMLFQISLSFSER